MKGRRKRHDLRGQWEGPQVALDLGWCVACLGLIDECYVGRVERARQYDARLIEMAGLSWRTYRPLPIERKRELVYALNWLMMPYAPPVIGTATELEPTRSGNG